MNPEKIYRVSQTQLSIARLYGGCTYNGDTYIYNQTDDTLTRSNVIKKGEHISKELKVLSKHQWDGAYEDCREVLTDCDQWVCFDEEMELPLRYWISLYGDYRS